MNERHYRNHFWLAGALVFLLAAVSAQADTLTVNSTADDGNGACTPTKCTLRDAFLNLHDAIPTEQISFSLPANSTIVLTGGTLPLNHNVVITGPGASSLTIARSSTAAHFRILDIAAGRIVDISGVTISNGVDDLGESAGAIHNAGTLSLTGCTISGNVGNTEGGAIFNSGTLNVNSSTISGNTGARGGGVCNSGDAAVATITNSTISGNSAPTGGGIENGSFRASKLTINNCTISGNTAASTGGAIFNTSTDATVGVTIANSTISGNTTTAANSNGGGISNSSGGTCKLFSTIVAKNTATTGPDIDNVGTVTSQGYNLIGNNQNTNMKATTGDQIGTPGNPIDPRLDPLHDNGGPTQTQALLTNSPAIDKGSSGGSTLDQRGFTRPVDTPVANADDGSDIGAYEVQSDELAAGCSSVIVNNANDTGTGSLRAVIAGACGGSTITFADNVRGAINLTSGELVLNKNIIINGPGANLLTVQRSASAATNFRIFHITGNFRDAISGLTISNGAGPSDTSGIKGGGILNAGTLTLSNDTVSLNSAIGGNGGGVYSSGALTVSNTTISGNKIDSSVPGSGGGIFNFGGTITVTNSTISGNSAVSTGGTTDHGGGIYSNTGTVKIYSSTISANKSDNGGGVLGENGANFQVGNTIIALNTAPSGTDVKGPLQSEGFNIFGDASPPAAISGPGISDQSGVSAAQLNLGPLQDNGGPTFTHALLSGSVAIDQGDNSSVYVPNPSPTDQRGLPRPVDFADIKNAGNADGSDIGAFELQVPLPTPTPTPTATPASGTLGNVSTRLQVGTGDNVLFAGFIIQGNASKTVLIRSAGPSLSSFGVPGALGDPRLELHDANNTIGTNDNWQTTQLGGVITSDQVAAIQNSGVAPSDPAEPAIIATLPAGQYTAIVQGVGGTQGVATAEVYDLSPNNGAILANISTRGFIQTGDNVMIGGFIVAGNAAKALIRATGPSLIPFGVNNALTNPQLELHDANGTLAMNDDWQTTQIGGIITGDQSAAIQNSGLAPSNSAESAIIATLAPGAYTAIAQGVNGGTGVGLIEVFALP
jgi:CSLREA domain-containing protein